MKSFLIILISLIYSSSFSQSRDINDLVNNDGIVEFYNQIQSDKPNYELVKDLLIKQINSQPKNAELKYYLAYTYDRLNGNTHRYVMNHLNKELTLKSSLLLEEVNRIEPTYKGRKFILDPYSKLSSIWGSLAYFYLSQNKKDSAIWALKEGKKRGGFIDPILDFNRNILKSCDSNAILITSGDYISLPIFYLQEIEKLRKDVIACDVGLINYPFYAHNLAKTGNIKYNLTEKEIDTLEYKLWSSKTYEINRNGRTLLSWTLKPSYYGTILTNGNWIILDIINNYFDKKPIYFTSKDDSTTDLSLSAYLKPEGILYKLINYKFNSNLAKYDVSPKLKILQIDSLKEEEINKSSDAIQALNYYRYTYYSDFYILNEQKKYKEAEKLIREMDKKFPISIFPFLNKEFEESVERIIEEFDSNK